MSDRENNQADDASITRRDAMRKAAGIGAVAGAAWAAPSINGMSIVPTFAAAASTAPIVMTGTATKFLGCFGPDSFAVDLTHPTIPANSGWWNFAFQGCTAANTESVRYDFLGGRTDCYKEPVGYQCKMELLNGTTVVYDTGHIDSTGNQLGGTIFIGTAAYPNGFGNMNWRITCV